MRCCAGLPQQVWHHTSVLPRSPFQPPATGLFLTTMTPGDRRKGPDRRGLATNRRNRMTKIITCSELRYRTLDELEALFRTLQIEFGRAAPASPERAIVL